MTLCPMCGAKVQGAAKAETPPVEAAPPLTSAMVSIPAESGMYRPQMTARPKDPTRPHAPVAMPMKPPTPPPAPKDPAPLPEVKPPPARVMVQPQMTVRPKDPTRPHAPVAMAKNPPTPPPEVKPPPESRRDPSRMTVRPKDPTRSHASVATPKEFRVIDRVPSGPPPEMHPPPEIRKVPVAAPPALSDFGFDSITVDPDPPPEAKKPPEPPPAPKIRDGDDESWYCSLPAVAAAPKPVQPAVLPRHAPIRPAPSPAACTAVTELVDASVLIDAVRPGRPVKALPAPARPLTAPLVLGVFAAVTGVLFPLTAALEGNRIFGTLGFCVSGLLLPLAPLAWIAGLAAEKRRREQGLRTERRVVVGRLLGQCSTLLLAAEGTIGLILVAAFRITGKIPISFWAR